MTDPFEDGQLRGVDEEGRHTTGTMVAPRRITRSAARHGTLVRMAGNVVNLNRFRKRKQRAERAREAEINRLRHGRTQAEKDRERLESERARRRIDGKRLEPDARDGEGTAARTPSGDPVDG